MISVLVLCYSRQEMLDITLPLWLKQEGVEYEICVARGPGIKVPEHWSHPQIRTTVIDSVGLCKAYNRLLAMAKGDILLITQCDMQVNSPTQLKRMLDKWDPFKMVTERFFKAGKRDAGIYLQFMLVAKEQVEKAGGWDEAFDQGYAFEDSDLVVRLMKLGLDFAWLETPAEEGVYHIDHPKPDLESAEVKRKLEISRAIYNAKHDETIMQMYAKQFAAKLMQKRLAV